ncbi:MAG TPA: MarR family transcriptional regulator [Actinocrinis sp.]|jgi:DNA-binding MarR family transcriptional regulator
MPGAVENPTAGYLIWRVANKWRAAVDRELAPLGLTHAQYTLLAPLYGLSLAGTRPSQRELADVAGFDTIYVSKLVRAMERSGFLAREEHPADPRAVQLILTDLGADTARRAVGLVRGLLEELTAPIGGTGSPAHRDLIDTLKALLGD